MNSPQTNKASKKRLSSSSREVAQKRRKIDLVALYDLIVAKNIKNDMELCKQARQEMKDGNKDLAEFLLRKSEKMRNEILNTAWKINKAEDEIKRGDKSRLNAFVEAGEKDCVCEEEFMWFTFATEILDNNKVNKCEFSTAVYHALEKGRRKKIMLWL